MNNAREGRDCLTLLTLFFFSKCGSSSTQSNNNNFMRSMSFTLFPKHQYQQLISSSGMDTSNKPLAMERRHQIYYRGLNLLKMGKAAALGHGISQQLFYWQSVSDSMHNKPRSTSLD
ncbi:hypothetical protein BCR42DRAFT_404272 [Absidia repens]|uniref:Uncharacterized protein n=1 Tax=Absidia repens TaxID=90262 RepID=A0A1X2IW12_9FUNG|nr:hypothetical protein BCR42DRAFT_404272 [Absidia repens]